MEFAHQPSSTGVPAGAPASSTTAAALLREAYDSAQRLQCPVWELAIHINSLNKAGVTDTALRFLLCQGYAEHADEITPPRSKSRSFRSLCNLTFTERTCFVLTQAAAELPGLVAGLKTAANRPSSPPRMEEDGPVPVLPTFIRCDDGHRELRVHDRVVKRFRMKADNQETILLSFQELGWPRRIDDPLPRVLDQEPKKRLHDTIHRLNRHLLQPLIRFHGDGNGQGVYWEIVIDDDDSATIARRQRDS